MSRDGQRRADLELAKRAVQGIIHDGNRSASERQRARDGAVQAQKLLDSIGKEWK
ncbi:MAG: hypothetical protein ACRDS1_02115 [Pseudonocardiaceae bacterium]